MESLYLTCIQCDAPFEFSVNEQKLYRDRGFDTPRRCSLCRKHKSKSTGDPPGKNRRDKKRDYHLKDFL